MAHQTQTSSWHYILIAFMVGAGLGAVILSEPARKLRAGSGASAQTETGKAEILPPPSVRTQVVVPSDSAPLVLRGSVVAGARLRLGFKISGQVQEILVREGDLVQRGQLLATLKAPEILAQAQAAESMKEKADRDSKLAAELSQAGIAPSIAQADAKTQLRASEANAAVAAEALRSTTLYAPVSGGIAQRFVEPGEAVVAGSPIVALDETSRLVVRVGVTSRDLRMIQANQRVTVTSDETTNSSDGAISNIPPSPDPTDGLYKISVSLLKRAVVPDNGTPRPAVVPPGTAPPAAAPVSSKPQTDTNSKPSFHPGELVTVRFDETKRDRLIRVPLDAIVHRRDKNWVFTVTGAGNEANAHIQEVKMGRADGREVVIVSGLQPEETIITEGAFLLQDNDRVRLAN